MRVIIEFSVIPMGEGTSVSKLIAHAVKALEDLEVKYETTPMGTIFEAESAEEALRYVAAAHEAVFKADAKRAVTVIKLDDRRDVERRMEDKVKSVKKAVEEL